MKNILISLLASVGLAYGAVQIQDAGIKANARIKLSKMELIPTGSVVGNVSGSPAVPSVLNGQQIYSLISAYVSGAHGALTGLSADDHTQYALLAGRRSGQTLIGGVDSRASVFLQPSSTGTGSVFMATKPGDSVIMGPLGALTTPNGVVEILVPNAVGNNNGLIVRANNKQVFDAQGGTGNAEGWAIVPKGKSGQPEIRCVTNGGDTPCYIRPYDSGFGNLYGYLLIGSQMGVMNSSASFIPWRVSGTTGQSTYLTQWSNQNDFGNPVAAIAKDGQVLSADGTAALPGHSFYTETSMGLYRVSSGIMAWVVGGVERMRLTASAIRMSVLGAAGVLTANSSGDLSTVSPGASNSTGSVLVSHNGNWVSSVVAVPPCQSISASNIDWSLGNCFTKTLSGNVTFTFTNRMPGQTIIVKILNPASYTYSFPATATPGNSVLWAASVIPTASTGGKKDIVTVFYDGVDMYGNAVQGFGGP